MTDSNSAPDSNPAKPRGLWSLMGSTESAADPASQRQEAVTPSQDSPEPAAEKPLPLPGFRPQQGDDQSPAQPTPRQRGLWGMMGATQPDQLSSDNSEPEAEPEPEPEAEPGLRDKHPSDEITSDKQEITRDAGDNEQQSRGPARRGLFALMKQVDDAPSSGIDTAVPPDSSRSASRNDGAFDSRRSAELSAAALDDIEDDVEEDPRDDRFPGHRLAAGNDEDYPVQAGLDHDDDEAHGQGSRAARNLDPAELEPPRYRAAVAQARKQTRICLASGICAVLASALSLSPNFFASLPSTALGFAGIISGYLALTGAGRRDISRTTRSICVIGMLSGATGIFLGPAVVANLGRSLRESTGLTGTRRHLQQIGEAIERHYTEHDGYPIGGTFARGDDGAIHGQHGWMTFLLPAVGETELYQQIDLTKPYDDPVNRNAMGRNVNLYFVPGADRARIGQGFSVAHFAGLGGEIEQDNRPAHIGIFERDVAVKRDEVIDGASSTLIVGELAGLYPPWGDPENWRKIGKGLNRDVNGFGSHTGNGATFLLGDGSVKHFSNKTDAKLLERMSTRDGSETE